MNGDLIRQNEQADALIQKLEQIKELWSEIPTVEEIEEIAKAAGDLAGCLDQATETHQSDNFPTVESLEEVARPASDLAGCLGQASEIYMSDDFPTTESLEEVARPAAELAESMGHVAETCQSDDFPADSSAAETTREDEVAAILFWRALAPETLEGMKKRLLGIAGKGEDRPSANTRLGLALIALTTPDTEEPSEEELDKAMARVMLLLTEEERRRLEG